MAQVERTAKSIGMSPGDIVSIDEPAKIIITETQDMNLPAVVKITTARVGNVDDWFAAWGIVPLKTWKDNQEKAIKQVADWGIRLPEKEARELFALYPIASLRYGGDR